MDLLKQKIYGLNGKMDLRPDPSEKKMKFMFDLDQLKPDGRHMASEFQFEELRAKRYIESYEIEEELKAQYMPEIHKLTQR
jgi:hypothetical protein